MIEKVNVGQDFLKAVKGHKVECFEISLVDRWECTLQEKFILKKGYSKTEFNKVVKRMLRYKVIPFEIKGIIWCKKGVWFERKFTPNPYNEIDEEQYHWWAKYSCPQIPDYLSWFGCVIFMAFVATPVIS